MIHTRMKQYLTLSRIVLAELFDKLTNQLPWRGSKVWTFAGLLNPRHPEALAGTSLSDMKPSLCIT